MMIRHLAQLTAFALVIACSEGSGPMAAPDGAGNGDGANAMAPAVTLTTSAVPFSKRAPLDPFQIIQQPDFMIQSKERSDIVFYQSVFAPGAGVWHTHPGPSFIYLVEGLVKLQRYSKDGCTETPVYTPGQAYFQEANQVHRAVVVSATEGVVLGTRFNIPVGMPFTSPAADPGC